MQEILSRKTTPNSIAPMKIFVSYGHDTHAEVVKRLAAAIESRTDGKISVWIDHVKIRQADHWRRAISEGIHECQSVMAFLSEYSARERGVCLDELAIAVTSKHGMIRTVLLESKDSFDPPALVTEYQWEDMSDYPEYQKQGESIFQSYIEQKADTLIAMLTNEEIQQYNREILFLRKKLFLPEIPTLSRFDLLLEKEMIGREWLTQKIETWLNDKNAPKIMMLYGKPGAGKSMYTAHMQHYNPRAAAAFACDIQSDTYSSVDSIITWLAYKLAMRLPDYRKWLINLFYDEHFDMGSGQDRFHRLITQPLGRCSIDGERETMMIIIDALDEARTEELATFVSKYVNNLKPWLRFLITARKETYLTEQFEGYPSIDLDECEANSHADLMQYYEAKLGTTLAGHPDKEAFFERLTKASEGIFTYAECVCINILEDLKKQPDMNLTGYPLPKGLFQLFKDTMDRKQFRYRGKDYGEFWQVPLGMVLFSPKPLPIATLKRLMDWGTDELKAFRKPLMTLLVEQNGCLQGFHRSFGEWLNRTNDQYAVSQESGIRNLAEACFEVYEEDIAELDEFMLVQLIPLLREGGRKKQYKQVTRDEEFLSAVLALEEKYYTYSQFQDAIPICTELMQVFEHADSSEDDGKWSHCYSIALNWYGRNMESLNFFSEALTAFQKALDNDRDLMEQYPKNPRYQRGMFVSLHQVAGILKSQNDMTRAKNLYEETLAIAQKLVEQYPKNPEYQMDMSVSLQRVAGILKLQNDLPRAKCLCEKALAIARKLVEQYPQNPQYQRGLSVSLNKVAGILESQKDMDGAKQLYEESLTIIRKLAEQYPENPQYQSDVSFSLNRVAGILELRDDLSGAKQLYEESLVIARKLARQYPENPQYQSTVLGSLERLAIILQFQDDLSGAKQLYEESLVIARKLARQYPENPEYQKNVSICLTHVATIMKSQDNLTEAKSLYEEALTIDRKLAKQYPENLEYQRGIYIDLYKIAEILQAYKDFAGAKKLLKEGLTIARKFSGQYLKSPQFSSYDRELSILRRELQALDLF